MYYYNLSQWLLLFFLYCFLGWVWESAFVSVRMRQWVNRGFLHGPWLPIYGLGAIIILFLTLPVGENFALIFLFGMAGATLLEYVTGAVMERLFHMRYWDYSDWPLNVNGYISLYASLAWGCFSILLNRLVHPWVEQLLLAIPAGAAEIASLVLVALFAVDVTKSVQAALDLKALLGSLTESSRHLANVEKRLQQVMGQLEQGKEAILQKIRLREEAEGEQSPAGQKESRKEYLLRLLEQRRKNTSRLLTALAAQNETALDAVLAKLKRPASENERSRLEGIKQTLLNIRSSLHKAELDEVSRRDRDYQRAVALLYRNPTAVSRRHGKALQELLALKKGRRTRKSGEEEKKEP